MTRVASMIDVSRYVEVASFRSHMPCRGKRVDARPIWKEPPGDAEKASIDGTPEPQNGRESKEKASLRKRGLCRGIPMVNRGFPTTLSSLSVSSKWSCVLATASTHRCELSYQPLNRPVAREAVRAGWIDKHQFRVSCDLSRRAHVD